MGSLNKKNRELCKIEELAGNDAAGIEDEINSKLLAGWTFHSSITKGNTVYLVFIK